MNYRYVTDKLTGSTLTDGTPELAGCDYSRHRSLEAARKKLKWLRDGDIDPSRFVIVDRRAGRLLG